MKRKYIWAYLDGKKLVEIIQASLDNDMTAAAMKKLITDKNIGHEIVFKVE